MTWPDGIAAALTAFALLITHHQNQHRSTTHTQKTRRTEHGHAHQDPQTDPSQEDDSQASGKEDQPGTEASR